MMAMYAIILFLSLASTVMQGGAHGAAYWRDYWTAKLPNVRPNDDVAQLAWAKAADPVTLQSAFICIQRGPHDLCLCTQKDIRVCSQTIAAPPQRTPQSSTCVFDFFYEYHKTCATPGGGAVSTFPPPKKPPSPPPFFGGGGIREGSSIRLPNLANPLPAGRTFLPRPLAQLLPFNSSQSLSFLHVSPSSPIARDMANTLDFCNQPPPRGQQSPDGVSCVTSIESMVDFVDKKMGGHKAGLVITSKWATALNTSRLVGTLGKVENMTTSLDNITVSCHNLVYPYLVYACHAATQVSILKVSFIDVNESALVVCHHNTSSWNPSHPAFTQLNTSPGDNHEICHWMPHHHFIWLPIPSH